MEGSITKKEQFQKELKKMKTINTVSMIIFTIAEILLIISIVINFFTLIGNVQ